MGIYEKAVKLNDEDFKEIIGVRKNTFDVMVKILKDTYDARPKKWRGGRKKKLSIEEQLILTLKNITVITSLKKHWHLNLELVKQPFPIPSNGWKILG